MQNGRKVRVKKKWWVRVQHPNKVNMNQVDESCMSGQRRKYRVGDTRKKKSKGRDQEFQLCDRANGC